MNKQELIAQFLSTSAGRQALAASMVRPSRCGGKDYPPLQGVIQSDIDICMCGCGEMSTIFRKSVDLESEYVCSFCKACWVKGNHGHKNTRIISKEEAMIYAVMWE